MPTTRSLIVAVALLGLSSCSGRSDLPSIVDQHCSRTEQGLILGVDAYGRGENYVMGLGNPNEPSVSTHLFAEFSFCLRAREGDQAKLAKLSAEFQGASQTMGEARDDRALRLEAMRQMVDLFARLRTFKAKR